MSSLDAGQVTLPFRPAWQSFLPLAAAGAGVFALLAWFGDAGVGVVLICLGAAAVLLSLGRRAMGWALVLDETGIELATGARVQRARWDEISDVRFFRFVPSRTGPGHRVPLPVVEALVGRDVDALSSLAQPSALTGVGAAASRGLGSAAGRAIHELVLAAEDNWEVHITVGGAGTKRLRGVHFEQPGHALLTLAGAVALRWPGAAVERGETP